MSPAPFLRLACLAITAALLFTPGDLVAGPKIGSPQPEFDFGDRESGTNVTGTFKITNEGDEPLVISKLLPGCGCTSAKITQETIPPGGEATITAVLSLKFQKGAQRKNVVIKSNDPDNPNYTVYLVGRAVSPIRIEPDRLDLGEIDAHAGGVRTIELVAPGPEKAFEITSVEVGDKESLAARFEEVEKGMAYRVHVTLSKEMTPGKYHSFVRIRTTNPQFNLIGVALTATVVGELTVEPSEIKIFDPKDSDGVARHIDVGPGKVSSFKVLGVQAPDPTLFTQVFEVDGKYRVVIGGLKPSQEMEGKSIIIKTDVPQMSAIRIPIHVVKTGIAAKKKAPARTPVISKANELFPKASKLSAARAPVVRSTPAKAAKPASGNMPSVSKVQQPEATVLAEKEPSVPSAGAADAGKPSPKEETPTVSDARMPTEPTEEETASQAPPAAGPKLVCDESIYNFGEREEGGTVEHTFLVKNIGTEPADMTQLEAQCGCAVLDTASDTLAPGEETPMTVVVSFGEERGVYTKSLDILAQDDAHNALTLTLEGFITPTMYVLPDRLELGRIDAGRKTTRTAIVVFAQEEPVKIKTITSDVGTNVLEVKALSDCLYRVTVQVAPSKGSSRIQSRVLLYTDSPDHPMVTIPVTATVLSDLAASPSEILVTGAQTESVTRFAVVRSPKGRQFQITDVQCPDSLKVKVEPLGSAGYRLEISGLTNSADLDGKSVRITTSLTTAGPLEIPLRVSAPSMNREETAPSAEVQSSQSGTLRIEKQNVNRGKVPMGAPVTHTFRLFNASPEIRHILGVKLGCSCAQVLDFSKEVPAQSYGEVTVSLDTSGNPGLRSSSVHITTDDPKMPQFNPLLSCHVLPAVEAAPRQILIASNETSGFPKHTVEVGGLNQDERISLGDIRPSDPMITVQKETIDEDRRFRLRINVSEAMPAGITFAHLLIPIEGSAQKSVWLPMTIANETKMKAEPSGLKLLADAEASQTAEFAIRTLDSSPLKVDKVMLADTELDAVLQQTSENAVLVRVVDLKVTQTLNLKHLHLLTNHGEFRIPISVGVQPSKAVSSSRGSASPTGTPTT